MCLYWCVNKCMDVRVRISIYKYKYISTEPGALRLTISITPSTATSDITLSTALIHTELVEPHLTQGLERELRAYPSSQTAHSTPPLPFKQPSAVAAAFSEPKQVSGTGHAITASESGLDRQLFSSMTNVSSVDPTSSHCHDAPTELCCCCMCVYV